MKSFLIVCCVLLFPLSSFGQQRPSFSNEEVQEDLKTLRESLEAAQINMYAYTSKQEFDSVYNDVRASLIADSLTVIAATGAFQRLVSSLNIGHTAIEFPVASYMEYARSGGTLFPLEVAFQEGRPLVRKNWSGNDEIPAGAEIISINGEPMDEILSKIYPHISAERPYFKRAKIEVYSFPRYYWQVFGEQDRFEVVTEFNGIRGTHRLEAADLIEGFEMKREEVLNASPELTFYDETAYLNPGSFSGDEGQYREFIGSSFAEIIRRGSENLIIDLRNNSGGDNAFSDYLISYFADKPFFWNSRFTLKTSSILKEYTRANSDTTSAYSKEILHRKDGEVYDYEFDPYQPHPARKRFKGEVYVLINRQSHSQAAVAAAQIQDYGLATLVGEETGEYPTLYASIFPYTLPNTGITVHISKGYIVRVNGSEEQIGVEPDIFISDYLRDEEDEILNGLLDQIKSR